MIQNDEASPRPARGTGVGDCVKCGTSYSSKVEFVQHLLLHIERTYPVVTLDRADVVKFEGATDHKDKMSAEGELKEEMDQVDEVKVETKPKLNNNFEIHADSNNLSSTKDGERSGSVSGDDDSMSMCSSTGMPANAPSDAPKMVVKAEVHIPKNEVAKSEEEANGRRSSESSQGKDQSGAEDEDDGKTSDGSKSPAKPTTPSLPFAITLRKSEDLMAQTNYNLIQEDFPNGEFHGPQKELYRCALCPRSFATAAELDAHAAADGHIICSMSEACASLSFSSSAALSHHQAMVHQAPAQTTAVQRLAAQVERLPQTFGSYPPQVPPQPYGGPSPYNHPPTSYNGPKLGSQVVLTPMSAVVVQAPQPPPNLPNLPGIQVTKRPAPPPVDSSPSKMNRGDDGMPSIRLPDSITLVKSQPAPPPQNAVADMLATRGITMVASGSRSGPTPATSLQPVAPAKRLPNVPSAISIVPSRPQPAQQAQRFAVPPAPPQQRGRHITNLGTVDLTREDQNGRMRGGPGRPIIPNSPRRFSCTICDKVYPTGESLQAHMAVHGSNKPGRYMCEICRVVYTNEAKLQHHKKTVHAVRAPADTEMVIPICDINQPGVKEKLLQCGIRHVVQVQSVRNANDTAAFGLPIIPIDLARNEAYSRLDDLGASNILSLGSLRNIYR